MNKHQINQLLAKIKLGSNEDFAKLYTETKHGVYAFLYTYYREPYSTEDAMQNVYLKIKLHIDSFKDGTNGLAWMLQIAKNLALNDLKSKNREVLPLTEEIVSDSGSSYAQKLEITDLVNRTLSEEDARIVTLHAVMGYKHREIGDMLGMPTGTVTSRYKRAIEKLRMAWNSTN